MTTPQNPDHAAWIVDLDGTLYRPLPVKLAMALELGLFGLGKASLLRRFRHEHEKVRELELEGDPFAIQIARTASAVGCSEADVRACVEDWMIRRPGRFLRTFRRSALIDEIARFRAGGGRTALVSDYPATQKLAALSAVALFDVVVASGESGGPVRLKPHPDGMLRAARALGVEPARCLVIGDRDDADGEAARAAGMAFRRVH
jgi:HAD superfamily hydrolase (TIGR01549 family)